MKRRPFWIVRNTVTGTEVQVGNLVGFCRAMYPYLKEIKINQLRYAIYKYNKYKYKNFEFIGAEYDSLDKLAEQLVGHTYAPHPHPRATTSTVKRSRPLGSFFEHFQGRECYN